MIFAILAAMLLSVPTAAQDETAVTVTPHISAPENAFAKTVIMPGDPLRAKYIAETFLDDAELITSVRNMLGYTGTYKGVPVSVMSSGMGMPSIGIYSWELFKFFGVETIVRVGSAGSYKEWLNTMDVTLAESVVSTSSYARDMSGETANRLLPSKSVNDAIRQKAKEMEIDLKMSTVHSTDAFYSQEPWQSIAERTATDCVEMESFALFHNANILHKNAACLLTISDSFLTNEKLAPEERETSFTEMILLALETVVGLETTGIDATAAVSSERTDGKYVEKGRVVVSTGGKKYGADGVRQE